MKPLAAIPDPAAKLRLPATTVLAASRHQMLSVEMVMLLLNIDRKAVVGLLEDGSLLYAWNVAVKEEGRPLIRILSQSVVDYENRLLDGFGSFSKVLDYLLPVCLGDPSSVELSRMLFSSEELPIDLAKAGLIKTVSPCRRGPGGSPRLSRSSLRSFLERRFWC